MKSVAERGDDDALRERAQPLQQQPDERAGELLGQDGGGSPPHQAPGHLALRHQEEERGGRENDCTLRPEPLQQQPEERAGGHRADNGVAATGPDGGEVAVPICLPATELYYNNVVNYTAMVSGRSTMCSLQQCRMEDHNKPNVLEEFVGINTEEEKFQSLFPEMEDEKTSYLDIGTPLPGSRADTVWRYAHGNYAHKTKQTMPNRP